MLDLQVIIDVIKDDYAIYLGYFTVLYVMVVIKIHLNNRTKDSKWYDIDPDKSIHSHMLFWIAITLPCYIILILKLPAFLMYVSKDDDFSVFKMFIDLDIKNSLVSIIALIAPLSLLVIRMHGSKQTAEQLSNQSRQLNNQEANDSFKHYLEHRSYIIDRLDHYQKLTYCPITFNSSELYDKIFPDLNPSTFNFDLIKKPSVPLTDLYNGIIKETSDFLERGKEKYGEFQSDSTEYKNIDSVAEDEQIDKDILRYINNLRDNFLFSYGIRFKTELEVIRISNINNKNSPNVSHKIPSFTGIVQAESINSAHYQALETIKDINKYAGLKDIIPSTDSYHLHGNPTWNHYVGNYKDMIREGIERYDTEIKQNEE